MITKLKQQLTETLNIDDKASLAEVKSIIDGVKPLLSDGDNAILDEAYEWQKNNPISDVVWNTLTANFTLHQIELFIEVNDVVLSTLDTQSDKLMSILSRVAMDSEAAQAYTAHLAEQQKQLH